MRNRWTILVLVTLVAMLAVGIGVWNHGRNQMWWGHRDSIRSRLEDPMASDSLLGMQLNDREETPHTGFFGKSRPPFVSRWFTPPPRNPGEVLNDVMAFATKQGWTPHADTATSATRTASKHADEHSWSMSLILAFAPLDPDHPTRNGALRVTLS